MAEVFLSKDLLLHGLTAVKVQWEGNTEARRRFADEGRLLAILRDPHLVRVLAAGGRPRTGRRTWRWSGEARLRCGPLPWREVVDLAGQMAGALAALHRVGVIHRDVKPSNIVQLDGATGRPVAKLIDLGIAKVPDWSRVQGGGFTTSWRRKTVIGQVVGTHGFYPSEATLTEAVRATTPAGSGDTLPALHRGAAGAGRVPADAGARAALWQTWLVHAPGHSTQETPMSVRATTRRGKLVWLVQVIRGGGSFNRRRYLDRRVFRKADAEAVEAELLAEYAAGAHNHEERGGAENTSKNAGSDGASRQASEVLALATVRPTTAQSVGCRTISTGADARASSSCSSATTSTPGRTEARAGEEPAASSSGRRRGRRAGGEISPAQEIASPTASKLSPTSAISPAAPATRAPTFADFAERFLALQDPTRSDYRNKDRNLRLHLVPVLGAMRLDAINRMVIDGLKVKLRTPSGHVPSSPRSLSRKEAPLSHRRWGGPRSPKTINNVLTTLRGVLGLAYDYELIPRIPRIKMEPVPKRDPGFLTEAEVERLLAAAPATWRLLLLTAAYTGLRRGELLALRWGDLHTDAARPFIRVQRSLQYLRSREVREKGPKGGRPRSVPMTAALTGELLARRPADASATDLVFTDDAGGYVDYRELWRVLSRAAKDAGLRKHVHPHLLRHTFASHCYMRGVPPQVVQLWLGHAHISTTERYAHLAPNTGEDLINLVAPTVRMIRGNTTANTKVSPKLKTASEGA